MNTQDQDHPAQISGEASTPAPVVITDGRLAELETFGPSEARLFKSELRELIAAYRLRGGPGVMVHDDGVWLLFQSASGKKAAISVDCLAAERGPIVGATLREWASEIATKARSA